MAKVISALEMRARDSYSNIAARLDVSEQLVQYHCEKAEKEKIILAYNAIIDITLISRSFHLLYISFFNLPAQIELNWIKSVEQQPGVSLVARTIGRWNATVGIVASNNADLLEKVAAALNLVKGKISELIITTEVECAYSSMQMLSKHRPVIKSTSAPIATYQCDEIDERILQIIALNCRASSSSIAKQLNIAASTVQRRITRLEEMKVIMGYKLLIDYEKLGFNQYRLLIKLSDLTTGFIAQLKATILSSGIVQSVSRYLGLADVDLRCNTASLEELSNFIDDLKSEFADKIIGIEIIPIFHWKNLNFFP